MTVRFYGAHSMTDDMVGAVVWQVCPLIKRLTDGPDVETFDCQRCPASETSRGETVTRACRSIAEDIVIAVLRNVAEGGERMGTNLPSDHPQPRRLQNFDTSWQQHDEMLKMRCLEVTRHVQKDGVYLMLDDALEHARALYHEITGREWSR